MQEGFLPKNAMVCRNNVTAVLREAASFTPGYDRISQSCPHVSDRLIEAYRLMEA